MRGASCRLIIMQKQHAIVCGFYTGKPTLGSSEALKPGFAANKIDRRKTNLFFRFVPYFGKQGFGYFINFKPPYGAVKLLIYDMLRRGHKYYKYRY